MNYFVELLKNVKYDDFLRFNKVRQQYLELLMALCTWPVWFASMREQGLKSFQNTDLLTFCFGKNSKSSGTSIWVCTQPCHAAVIYDRDLLETSFLAFLSTPLQDAYKTSDTEDIFPSVYIIHVLMC